MATMLFLNENHRPPEPDPNFHDLPRRMFQYMAQTDKVLKMKRIFIEEVGAIDEDELLLAKGEVANLEHLRVTKTYEEALNQFLLPDEKPPREFPKPTTEGDDSAMAQIDDDDDDDDNKDGADLVAMQLLESDGQLRALVDIDAVVDAEIASNLEQLLNDNDDMPFS